jgi:hypothetical protein
MMKRRGFISQLGSAVAPLAARAQQEKSESIINAPALKLIKLLEVMIGNLSNYFNSKKI